VPDLSNGLDPEAGEVGIQSVRLRFDPGSRQLRPKVIVRQSDAGRLLYLVLADEEGASRVSLCIRTRQQARELLEAALALLSSLRDPSR
jgi:hypothetical protein